MLTVEQYIAQRKKKDKLDEFNFQEHAENMSNVIKYVMEYFNDYLNPENYDYEKVKTEQAIVKIEKEIEQAFPQSKAFIIEYYRNHKTRIDRLLKNSLKELYYVELYYCREDYEDAVGHFCESRVKEAGIEQYREELIVLAQEIKENDTKSPKGTGYKYLDNALVAWIKETHRQYGVNLYQFAAATVWPYYEKYIEYVFDRENDTSYDINRYNHRYNNNPFEIDEIYQDNLHRPFIAGRKGELEMLMMHIWINDYVKDPDYWPEYVNLCVSTGRVSIVGNINILLPVKYKDIAYPDDVGSSLVFAETTTAILNADPNGPYILQLNYKKDDDIIWKNEKTLDDTIANLKNTFSKYGAPHALELLPPLRSPVYNEEQFFAHYRLLEKGLKKYSGMKIVLVNGPSRQRAKAQYLMQTSEDAFNLWKIAKDMKFKLKFALNLGTLIQRKYSRSDYENDFGRLSEMRNSIVGIHLSRVFDRGGYFKNKYPEDGKYYLNKFEYPEIPDFLSCISELCNDNQSRYFIPEGVSNQAELEELVDDLLRGGFSFCNLGENNG